MINQKTIEEAMCKLGFDAVLKQLGVLGDGKPVRLWSHTTKLTPYDGVPRLTPVEKKRWKITRYSHGIECGQTNVNERFAQVVATTVCFDYIRMLETEEHHPRRSSRLKQKRIEKCWGCMDKTTGLIDPIQMHRQLGLFPQKQKMLYATTGYNWNRGEFVWGWPEKGKREIHYMLVTPPDWDEHVYWQ